CFGKLFCGTVADVGNLRLSRLGKLELVIVLDQAAGLDKTRGAQSIQRDHEPRRETESVGDRVGFGKEHGAKFEASAAQHQPVADLEAETFEKEGRSDRAMRTAPLAE